MCIRDRPLHQAPDTVHTDLLAGADGRVTAARLRVAPVGRDGDWTAAAVTDAALDRYESVSYTHLDVYKRQGIILLLLATLLLVWLLVGLAGLVARVGLVRGIDRIDAGADAPNLRQAWGLGWSARTLRLLLAEVLMGILSLILILSLIHI